MGVEGVWVKIKPDSRGYTDCFKCSNCGTFVYMRLYYTECEYPYCPWCRCELIDTEEEAGNAAD